MMKTRLLPRLTAVLLMGLMALSPIAHADHDDGKQITIRPDVTYTLRTDIAGGKLVFIGESGKIKDQANPDLKVPENSVVQINLLNGDGAIHHTDVPDRNAKSDQISGKGSATAIVFRTGKAGELDYVCTLPGHIQAGMIGKLIVGEGAMAAEPTGMQVAKNPTEVGKPIGKRGPQKLTVKLETTEVVGQLDD